MHLSLFLLFSLLAAGGAVALVLLRNPVACAMAMVTSFLGMAALFFGMNAYFVGIIQILVYTGAIMVLFLFIIMLLDLKVTDQVKTKGASLTAAVVIPLVLVIQLIGVLGDTPDATRSILDPKALVTLAEGTPTTDENGEPTTEFAFGKDTKITQELAKGRLPDVHLIGHKIFTEYNAPLQVMGLLLLVATVGCVVLSKRDTMPTKAVKEHTPPTQ